MNKSYRQSQILKLIRSHSLHTQDEVARALRTLKIPATQVTLSRDIHELGLVKTPSGYSEVGADAAAGAKPGPDVAVLAREVLRDIRQAQNLLVLKTPPGGAQPLAAALDSEHWKEIAGSLAGDDTVLIITPSRNARAAIQKRIEEMLR